MARKRNIVNPFFPLLGIVGAVFFVSAFVYGMMTIQFSHAVGDWAESVPSHPLLVFFSEHGAEILAVELVVLGLFSVAAIWTDDYWIARASRAGTAHQRGGHK